MISNRVIAQLIWLSIAVILLLLTPKGRLSIAAILQALTQILRQRFTLIGIAWLILIIYVAFRVGFWDVDLMTVTVWWSLASGTVLFMGAATTDFDTPFFIHKLRDLFSVTFVVEILVALVEMPLLMEFLLVPVSFIILLITFSDYKPDNKTADLDTIVGYAQFVASILGVVIIGFNIWSWISGRVSVTFTELAREAALPVYLTIMFFPFLYYLSICVRWELLYKKIKDLTSTEPYMRRIWKRLTLVWTVIRVSGPRLKSSRFLTGPIMLDRIFASDQPNKVRKTIQDQLEKVHREEAQQRELAERLERYAGVTGVDDQGRQLDRREFSQTCEMLEILHMSYASRWNQDKHYIIGLKDSVIVGALDPFPSNSFHEELSDKADSWFIWRPTVTGWVFAIGAVGPPPSYWYYDGPDPPSGPPRKGSNWIADEKSLNWE